VAANWHRLMVLRYIMWLFNSHDKGHAPAVQHDRHTTASTRYAFTLQSALSGIQLISLSLRTRWNKLNHESNNVGVGLFNRWRLSRISYVSVDRSETGPLYISTLLIHWINMAPCLVGGVELNYSSDRTRRRYSCSVSDLTYRRRRISTLNYCGKAPPQLST